MSNKLLKAILTGATCGFSCWYAEEDICRCSCGGDNHGCMIDGDVEPEKIVKIDGEQYRLEAVGPYNAMNNLSHRINQSLGWKRIDKTLTYTDGSAYHYGHYSNDKGAATRVRTPAGNQTKWPELDIQATKYPYILWVKVDFPEPLWCVPIEKCDRCIDRMFDVWVAEVK